MRQPEPPSQHHAPRHLLREIGLVWRGGWSRLRSLCWLILIVTGIGVALIWLGNDVDKSLLEQARLNANVTAKESAIFISDYSDLNFAVPVSLAFWIFGVLRRRARWRRMGIACIMAALMAGLIVNIFKVAVGRPRPDAVKAYPDSFYGFNTRSKLRSYPSGHTATSTATGVSLIASAPIVAIPAAIYASSVGWSRLQLRKHHPIDVAVGGFIGLVCGASFASTVPGSVIRLKRRKKITAKH